MINRNNTSTHVEFRYKAPLSDSVLSIPLLLQGEDKYTFIEDVTNPQSVTILIKGHFLLSHFLLEYCFQLIIPPLASR